MDAVLQKFVNELDDLRKLVQFYETENKLGDPSIKENPVNSDGLLLFTLAEHFKSFRTSKRQFNYNSLIISLYGFFEKFIENTIETYITRLNSVVKIYEHLPESVKERHMALSLILLSKFDNDDADAPLRKKEIIENLHHCLNQKSSYKFNVRAFSAHTANFRVGVIDTSFTALGLSNLNDKIRKRSAFHRYTTKRLGLLEESVVRSEEAFDLLNDLAERRNDVAHGVVAGNILQNNLFVEYIDFFQYYTTALVHILTDELNRYEAQHSGLELGLITDLFRNGVICIYTNNVSIKRGGYLIGLNESVVIKTTIEEIRLANDIVLSTDEQANYEVGLKLLHPFKENFKVFWLENSAPSVDLEKSVLKPKFYNSFAKKPKKIISFNTPNSYMERRRYKKANIQTVKPLPLQKLLKNNSWSDIDHNKLPFRR
ncbi:MAG: hypothetical protein JWQ66_2384 [Mucilaginibacter sp.]|nr:hypothetical protein [Mucilaginibacter sp.]